MSFGDMRQCGNCEHCKVDIKGRWYCEILHAEAYLNDDGCIYHQYERSFTLD